MTAVAQKTVLTGCLAPIDKNGLEQLIVNGKANPKVIKTLKCKTVAEGKFRHANYIRNLAPYIVDEPPGLSGRRHRAQSVGSLAGGAGLVPCGWPARQRGAPRLDRQQARAANSRAISTSPRCGAPATSSEKPVGFTDVRVKVDMRMRGHSAKRDRRAGDPRQEMVAGRQHVHAPGQSRGERLSQTRNTGCGRRSWVHWLYHGSKRLIGPHLP